MSDKGFSRTLSRRDFCKFASAGLVGTLAGAKLSTAMARELDPTPGVLSLRPTTPGKTMNQPPPTYRRRLAVTDGHIFLPNRTPTTDFPDGKRLYIFGFLDVPLVGDPAGEIGLLMNTYKGLTQMPSPIIGLNQETPFDLTLTNLGLIARPDLDDSHTIHWHGFPRTIPAFDGVPHNSFAAPVSRDLTYYYVPHDPGTYIYHCHFEDTEHVQMAMIGMVYVYPTGLTNQAYVQADPFDREFSLLVTEIDTRPHDGLELVQEFVWSTYKPNYWVINGRTYPDTIRPNYNATTAVDPLVARLQHQPLSSLVQCNPGESILLRLASLGYEHHSLQLLGIPMRVIGQDATFLEGPGGEDLSYECTSVYMPPSNTLDIMFEAPAFNAAWPTGTDGVGQYNVYQFRNRHWQKCTNGGAPGQGGMITEVRVYNPTNPVPAQTVINQTYPA